MTRKNVRFSFRGEDLVTEKANDKHRVYCYNFKTAHVKQVIPKKYNLFLEFN